MELGYNKGVQQGMQQGVRQGMQQGQNEMLQLILKLKDLFKAGKSIDELVEISGLDKDQVEKIVQ